MDCPSCEIECDNITDYVIHVINSHVYRFCYENNGDVTGWVKLKSQAHIHRKHLTCKYCGDCMVYVDPRTLGVYFSTKRKVSFAEALNKRGRKMDDGEIKIFKEELFAQEVPDRVDDIERHMKKYHYTEYSGVLDDLRKEIDELRRLLYSS